mmetsp:Transcript_60519/g.141549  ORF Transcript_60519/g.141549 Transcript_60519/m.141549 type:complete len:282 (-) Transcript_60519:297-1142(-)
MQLKIHESIVNDALGNHLTQEPEALDDLLGGLLVRSPQPVRIVGLGVEHSTRRAGAEELRLQSPEVLSNLRVELQGRAGPSSHLPGVLDFQQCVSAGVEVHDLDGTVQQPLPRDSHLLARNAGDADLTLQPPMRLLVVSVLRHGPLLHMVQGATQAQVAAVMQNPADGVWEEEAACSCQLGAPSRHRTCANGQGIRELAQQRGRKRVAMEILIRAELNAGGGCIVEADVVESRKKLEHRGGLASCNQSGSLILWSGRSTCVVDAGHSWNHSGMTLDQAVHI